MRALGRLVEAWHAEGLELGPPASPEQLEALGRALGTELPEDLVAFYGLSNGMSHGELDDHYMSFWSIPKILSEDQRTTGSDPNGSFHDLAVADYLINSWFLNLRVRGDNVSLFLEGSGEEFPSIEAFALRYLEAPGSLPIA